MLSSFLFSESPTKPDPRQFEKPGEGGQKPEIGRPVPRPHFPSIGANLEVQLKDYVELPGNFGMGSSTLANWIKQNISEDKANGKGPGKPERPTKEKPEILTDKEKLDPPNSKVKFSKKSGRYTLREDARRNWMPCAKKWKKTTVSSVYKPYKTRIIRGCERQTQGY